METKLPVDHPRALARACPGTTDSGPRRAVRIAVIGRTELNATLVVPRAAARVGDRVGKREEELHSLLGSLAMASVVIGREPELGEEVPVPRRQLGARSVGPVLGDHLVFVGQSQRSYSMQGLRLGDELSRSEPRRAPAASEGRPDDARTAGTCCQCAPTNPASPALPSVHVRQRLPPVDVVDRGGSGGTRVSIGSVHRRVARCSRSRERPVFRPARRRAGWPRPGAGSRARPARRRCRSRPGWRCRLERCADRARGRSRTGSKTVAAAREKVDRSSIGGVADRLDLALGATLTSGPSQRVAQASADCRAVVGRPGVVDARVRDRERSRDHRRAE